MIVLFPVAFSIVMFTIAGILLLLVCRYVGSAIVSEPRVVRTPEERFANLASYGYPWSPNYLEVNVPGYPQLRMHYLDIGKNGNSNSLYSFKHIYVS